MCQVILLIVVVVAVDSGWSRCLSHAHMSSSSSTNTMPEHMCTMEMSKRTAADDIDRLSMLKWLQANRNEGCTIKATTWAAQR